MKRLRLIVSLIAAGALGALAERAFPIGEQLRYSIRWNGVPVAHSEVTTALESFGGREVLAIRMRSQTYPFFNWFFKADDRHESLVDPETLLPIRFTKNLREGRYRCHEVTTFDHAAGVAHYAHQTNGRQKSYAIEADTRDLLSFMYFMRADLLEPGQESVHRVMADEKIYELGLRACEVVAIDLPRYARAVPSLEVIPRAKFDGLFVKKGNGTVWLSRDSRRLLTTATMSVPFGRVRITLQDVRGPGRDFWITEKRMDDE